MVQLLANYHEPPEMLVGLFLVVVEATLVAGGLGRSGAKGGGVIAEGLKPDSLEDTALCKESSGFVDFEVLW